MARGQEKSVSLKNRAERKKIFEDYVDSMNNDSDNNYNHSRYIYINTNNNTTNMQIITNQYNTQNDNGNYGMNEYYANNTWNNCGYRYAYYDNNNCYNMDNYCGTCGNFDNHLNYYINTNDWCCNYGYRANDFNNYIMIVINLIGLIMVYTAIHTKPN